MKGCDLMKDKTCEVYLPEPWCKECGGRCCKNMGCHYSPDDFKDKSFEALKSEIEKGKISIDWWAADEPEYYLRARHVDAPIVDGSWGGICINLTENGCSLSFEDRPLGGKALKPVRSFGCPNFYTKEMCKNDWKPYAETLKKLVLCFYTEYEKNNDCCED